MPLTPSDETERHDLLELSRLLGEVREEETTTGFEPLCFVLLAFEEATCDTDGYESMESPSK
jgi:hypothetical protein